MKQSIETRLRRRMTALGAKRTITIDDASEAMKRMGQKPKLSVIRSVLAKPRFYPIGWKRTAKASRHGRPIRLWKLNT